MSRDDHADSPLHEDDQEVAADVATESDALLSLISDFYRGAVNQAENSQNRIDQTTNWAITLIAALLSVVFSSPDMPAFLLLVGVGILCVFLSYEVRRYRFFDLYRSRVRFVEENVYANALEPSGVEHLRWREELSDDLRNPTFKVTTGEALGRRVRRIYGLLFVVLGVAWTAKVTLFTPETQWTEAAELPGVPGTVVAGALVAFYVAVAAVAMWPGSRQAKGEVSDVEPGKWKGE
ncbi:DUF2270 domain-containing protein [Halobacterium wangiae]|uniref:DUF2270 domain-containing protein n=1 Tax=Halobacterium wangiae TaxID=2902623 RepID=UPI001E448F8E|nr:DUF2270 domain-containing protein [Halobacterium wangiae]